MKAPLSWLREYVSTDATDAEIARRLTISSLEVDRLLDVGVADEGGNLAHFVVGRVIGFSSARSTSASRIPSRSSAARGTSAPARPSPWACPGLFCPASPARSRSGRSAARCPAG
jgi:hypothetical protein